MDARILFFCTVLSSSAAEVGKILTGTEGGNITLPHAVRDSGFISFGHDIIVRVTKTEIKVDNIYKDRLIWDQNTGLFTLTGLQRNDSGNYVISPSAFYTIRVYGSVPTPAVVSLSVSAESCTLLCSVDKAEDTTLLWHKDEEPLNQSSSALSLLLTVNEQDFSSSYRCVAASPAENKTSAVDIETLCSVPSKPERHYIIGIVVPVLSVVIIIVVAFIKRKCHQTHESKRRPTQAEGSVNTEVHYTEIEESSSPDSSATDGSSHLKTVYDKLEVYRMQLVHTAPHDNI